MSIGFKVITRRSISGNDCLISFIFIIFHILCFHLYPMLILDHENMGIDTIIKVSMTISFKVTEEILFFWQCLPNLHNNQWKSNFRQWKPHCSESMGIDSYRVVTKINPPPTHTHTVKCCHLATRLLICPQTFANLSWTYCIEQLKQYQFVIQWFVRKNLYYLKTHFFLTNGDCIGY